MTGAALALSAALLLWMPAADLRVRRVELLSPTAARPTSAPTADPRRRWLFAAGAALAVGMLVGGGAGLVAAGVVAVAGERVLRRTVSDEGTAIRRALLRDLPGACDLLGVCVAAGMLLRRKTSGFDKRSVRSDPISEGPYSVRSRCEVGRLVVAARANRYHTPWAGRALSAAPSRRVGKATAALVCTMRPSRRRWRLTPLVRTVEESGRCTNLAGRCDKEDDDGQRVCRTR